MKIERFKWRNLEKRLFFKTENFLMWKISSDLGKIIKFFEENLIREMWNWDFCSGWAFWSRFSRFCECPLRSKSLNSSFWDVIRRGKLRLHPRLWLKVSHCDSKYKIVRAMNKFFFKISEFLFFLLKKLKNHQKFKFPAKFSPWSLKILVFLLKMLQNSLRFS